MIPIDGREFLCPPSHSENAPRESGVSGQQRAAMWVAVTDRLPPYGEGLRVVIHTDGYDFAGEQFFHIKADALTECGFEDIDYVPRSKDHEVAARASHWVYDYELCASIHHSDLVSVETPLSRGEEPCSSTEGTPNSPHPIPDVEKVIGKLRELQECFQLIFVGDGFRLEEAISLLEERERLERERDEVGKALVRLTPDGSEFYKRDGDGYVVDTSACIDYITRGRDSLHNVIAGAIKGRREAEARALSALKAVEERDKTIGVFAFALDEADRIIERACGMDVPKDWHETYRACASARAALKEHGHAE